MPRPDETFIVRVRHQERDAVIEQPRLSRRRRVRDVSQVSALILRWLGWDAQPARPRRQLDATERRHPEEEEST